MIILLGKYSKNRISHGRVNFDWLHSIHGIEGNGKVTSPSMFRKLNKINMDFTEEFKPKLYKDVNTCTSCTM